MSELRPYLGEAKREPAIVDIRNEPQRWRVRITPILGTRRTRSDGRGPDDAIFEVKAEWYGTPPPGSGFAGPSEATDMYVSEDRELAHAIARQAAVELWQNATVDLAAISRRLQERR